MNTLHQHKKNKKKLSEKATGAKKRKIAGRYARTTLWASWWLIMNNHTKNVAVMLATWSCWPPIMLVVIDTNHRQNAAVVEKERRRYIYYMRRK